ncbi:unnamed protein product, partial [Prorocentrum cordatum]
HVCPRALCPQEPSELGGPGLRIRGRRPSPIGSNAMAAPRRASRLLSDAEKHFRTTFPEKHFRTTSLCDLKNGVLWGRPPLLEEELCLLETPAEPVPDALQRPSEPKPEAAGVPPDADADGDHAPRASSGEPRSWAGPAVLSLRAARSGLPQDGSAAADASVGAAESLAPVAPPSPPPRATFRSGARSYRAAR